MSRSFVLLAVAAFTTLSLAALVPVAPPLAIGQAPLAPALPAATPVPGGPGYVMLPGTAFQVNNTLTYRQLFRDGVCTQGVYDVLPTYHAPVSLPDHSHVTQLTMYFKKNDTDDVSAELIKLDLCEGGSPTMASVTSAGLSLNNSLRSVSTVAITSPGVDGRCTALSVEVNLPPATTLCDLMLHAVRIDYAFTTALPAVVK